MARDTTRGISRDKKARSAAAEALLREKSPPKEFRMGLGWAVLHVDVVIYTEDKNMAQPRRVPGHMQWSNFWNTYQVRASYVVHVRVLCVRVMYL